MVQPGPPHELEYTDTFADWWSGLRLDEQRSVDAAIRLLEVLGPYLPFPHSSGVKGSRYRHMRELRIQHRGRPFRILYAFDPRRKAILPLGGDKGGDRRWYERFVPRADRLYEAHLRATGQTAAERAERKE